MYYVYLLESEVDGSFYIGYTSNVKNRLWEHNFGRTRFTKLRRPWRLIYQEEFDTRGEAIKREKYLKKVKNNKYLKKIIGLGP